MNVSKLSEAASITTVNEIAEGFKTFVKNNPESAKPLLEAVAATLDELNNDDFFGTEGWLHTFGIE